MNKMDISIKRQKTLKEIKMKFWSGKLQKLKFKNLLEGFKDSFEQAEERIHKLKYRTMEIIKVEEQKEKKE